MINLSGRIIESEEIEEVKIGKKDKKILALLCENSRTPISEIAKKVMLSRDAVDYRIKRMEDKGVIIRFVPVITFKKLGYSSFHTFMLLDESEKNKEKELINELIRHPNVRNMIEYSDTWDLEVVFLAKNLKEFDAMLTEIISKYSKVIKEKTTVEVIKNFKSIFLPHKLYEEVTYLPKKKISDTEEELDAKDTHIINILSQDARQSTYKIAERVDLSPDAVNYRIKKLVQKDIINKFSVLINLTKIGFHWFTFAINFSVLNKKDEMRFAEFVHNHPYIIRAVKMHGEWDTLLYITTDTAKSFHSTIQEIKAEFADIIKNYQTWIAYKEHCYNSFPRILGEIKNIKKVLVFGTFDLLHPGHIQLFKEAKKEGDYLTVVVARDETVKNVKGKESRYSEEERLAHVSEISSVDQAILGKQENKYDVIEEVNPDIICLGYDQTAFTEELEKEITKRGLDIKIIRLKSYNKERFKSSKLKA